MKKFALILISAALLVSLTACGSKDDKTASSNTDSSASQSGSSSQQTAASAPTDSLELLNTVWNNYAEDDKFSVSGGDADNMAMNAAGKYNVADASALDSSLGFPAAEIDKIDDAASLLHMMNANTFTCGAYRVKEGTDTAALAAAIQTNVQSRQWMCGFPDKLIVASVDGYVVAFFGENEIMDTFKKNLTATYSSAEILCEEAIA